MRQSAEQQSVRGEDDPSALARFVSAGALAILEQFKGSPLLEDGKLTLVGVDAIAERLGSRWALRRDLVHEHVQRVLRKELGSQALVQRISETEYIVAQSELPKAAGQLRCLNCLREILHHFLGEAPPGDLRVHEVTRITPEGIFGARLDATALQAAEAAEARQAKPSCADSGSLTTLDRWTPFTTSTGITIGVTCALEPVIHLRNGDRIGYRVASRVQHLPAFAALSRRQVERLSTADIERIDFATIARGFDRVRLTAANPLPAALIVPVSHVTLKSRRGRATLIDLLRRGREFVRHGLICEITGVGGAPSAALHEMVFAIEPFCLRVIARVADPAGDDLHNLSGAGFLGLSARRPARHQGAQFYGWMQVYGKAMSRVAKTLFLYQVRDVREAHTVAEMGVTHATLAPQRLKVHFIDDEPV